ncbi:hybrid sensor histidine kinase/response regulator [Rheinheimera texasensis]|uniref:hybrid sensor histidine kinase/response regulator n=1 Tax=Rheinheimera texasensis TaxID=306205 RepID=UPI0009FF6064|nr:hybrid sensor histidine kinase/response regulator [Rheinheimera texasensis]
MTCPTHSPQLIVMTISRLMADLSQCFTQKQIDTTLLQAQLDQLTSVLGIEAVAVYETEKAIASTASAVEISAASMLLYRLAGDDSLAPKILDCQQIHTASGSVSLSLEPPAILLPLVPDSNQRWLLVKADASQQQQVMTLVEPWCRLLSHFLTQHHAMVQDEQHTQSAERAIAAATAIPWQLDTLTDHLEVDAAGYKLLGLSPAETGQLTQQWLFQQMHPDDVHRCRSAFSQYLRGQAAIYDCVGRLRHRAGYWVWIHSRGQIRCFPGGRQKLLGLYFDVTDRMQAQLQLETLTSCVPGVVFQYLRKVNGNRSFPYLSPQAEQLFGLSLDELRKDASPFLQKVHPDDLEVLGQRLDQSSKSLQVLQARFRLWSADGEYLWYQGKAQPEQLASGDVLWHGHLSDITAEIAVEEEMRLAKEQAEQASRFKSSFLANMSHEIRTPMNGVLGMLDVLSAGLTEPQQQANIKVMRESATALLTVIDDILDFSKLDAGKLAVIHEPCDLSELLHQIMSVLDELALKQQIYLSFFVDPAVPLRVMADGGRLRQVLLNLLSNAIKFSAGTGRQGKVHVALTVLDWDEHDVLLCFSVKDNGIGMSETSLQRLFKPFVQADDSTSRRFGGTGLGLSISQQLVHLMGGLIEVNSQPDLGSEFKVMLPLQVLQSQLPPTKAIMATEVVIVSSQSSEQATEWGIYLQAAGCSVQLTQQPDLIAPATSEACAWLIDCSGSELPDGWIDLASRIRARYPQHGVVVMGRGRRRKPRLVAEKQVYLDANVLTCGALFDAINLLFSAGEPAAAPVQNSVSAKPDFSQRILVLEDNSTNQIVIRQMLLQLGYQSDVAADGVQGLQFAQQNRYDLILTDLHMPLLDGYEFCRAWRDIENLLNLPPIPVLALTANVMQEEQQRCYEAGMNGCLTKPLPIVKLEQSLAQWLHPEQYVRCLESATTAIDQKTTADVRFDRDTLAKTVGTDAVDEVLADYTRSYRQHMPELVRAVSSGNMAQISAIAHKLKSSSSFVGLTEFAKSLKALELAARRQNGDACDNDYQECWQHCLSAARLVEQLLQQL